MKTVEKLLKICKQLVRGEEKGRKVEAFTANWGQEKDKFLSGAGGEMSRRP